MEMKNRKMCKTCNKIKEMVEDRLFELRRTEEMTPEKAVLAKIELILHESEENDYIC